MSKRRRTSSIASRGHEEDSLDSLEASTSSGPTMRKRKKNLDPMELCHQMVPKRRQEPGYYNVVTNPIDLLKVQQKLKTDEYEDLDDLQSDIELIVNNTKAFYKRNSHQYKDATELWELFQTSKNKLLNIEEEPRRPPNNRYNNRTPRRTPIKVENRNNVNHDEDTNESVNDEDDTSLFEELFAVVMTATDDNKKLLHNAFQLLPSKKKYPEYYEVIEQPIDLKMIATKVQNHKYSILAEMERDLLLMCKNACLFNEPGSQIYKHAKLLKKVIQTKKIDMEQSKLNASANATPVTPTNKISERIRNKRLRGSFTAVTAAIKYEDSEPEVEQEDDDGMEGPIDADNPQWKLFETVRTMAGNNGVPLAEPFWRLPSRRFYPDYYREIKNPVSLTQIRRKLTNKAYGTVSEVAGDMTIMFENAKKYNIATSKLYRDAVKLQKLMQTKVQELLDIDQVTQRVTNKNRKDGDNDIEPTPTKKKPGPKPKNPTSGHTPTRGRPPKDSIPLKKRLHALAKYMLDYTVMRRWQEADASIHGEAVEKLYRDYYEVIAEPIDFLEIESKIKAEQYSCEKDLVKDFKTMFENCRQYNEENSPIYEDATMLEKYLMDKAGHFFVTPEKEKKERVTVPRVYKPRKPLTPLEKSLKTLYETIRDYREPKANRQLSQIFMKLPSKIDYPDYFEVITHPIDMERIYQKLKSNCYESLDDLVADFTLMFDNACKYNEPDSQIYKDALVLQRVCFQTKLLLKEDENTVPDVQTAVQDILLNLFTNVYNHQDDDGRCYSDSMTDLPEHDEIEGKKIRGLSLDLLKRRLDKGVYKRLDVFQEDFFACMERARRLSRTDSQIFEDSVELQMYFIRQRDELCRNGELLSSPALIYTISDAKSAIEQMRQNKLLKESLEDETETRSSDDSIIKDGTMNVGESMTCNQQTFKVGEFVYLDTKEKGCEPHILLIERLWENNGQQMLYGNYYLRPAETYHLTTRKFLEREVFKSDSHVTVPLEEVRDQCCVVNVKHYYTMRPEGYDDKDVYVCESRYSTRCRSFKKIKMYPENPTLKLVPREVPLEPKRVMSVFRERVEKHKDELAELEEQEKLVEKDKPNVESFVNQEIDDGNTYYEQYNTICSGVVKTGDFVYVVADGGKQIIAQIDSLWDTKDGKCYFRGPWFITPTDIPYTPGKLFYKQEVFLSSLEDTNPIVSIIGKCAVLEYNDYVSCRPTEVPEADVFIGTSMYDEINRQLRKLPPEGLKKYLHSPGVTEDEVYYFPRLLNPPRVSKVVDSLSLRLNLPASTVMPFQEPSPQLTRMNDMDIMMEDSLDGGPPSVGSGEIPVVVPVHGTSTPATPATTKKKSTKNKVVTGYILYSREVRKQVVQNNPESKFGDISRIVGSEWKSLPTNEKQQWEEKASKLNEETKAMLLLDEQCSSPAPPPIDQIFECLWENCDYQFEEQADLIEHCIKDKDGSQGHVQAYFQENQGADLNCHWRNCGRIKKNAQPFPNMARLIRHVRDMHINKGNGRSVAPESRSKNFKPSSKPQSVNRPTPSATPNPTSATAVVQTSVPKVQEPMFISVPPRPQRVLHSEAYIKYIEGLQAENKHVTQWERTLNATPENTLTPDMEKLQHVATWLGRKADQHDNVVAALWALRNQLLKDTLGLHKTL
ncbi:hypothetical protein NQ317_008366 [Molorchus minor]|uniref:Protein polybromo-1 n=1 Tax=Molorchus minor TaxID=1323400 RepID=A0ABQ9K4R7_9CUCU|nr:hypothetical protein NQ317_008366 [Molorchus minor]